MDLFENAVFMSSCERVKTELFENADVTASIHYVSEHAHGSWGSRDGILPLCFLLLKFENQSLHVAASWCGRGSIRKRSSCGREYFLIRIKKMRFQKYPDTCGRGLRSLYVTGKDQR